MNLVEVRSTCLLSTICCDLYEVHEPVTLNVGTDKMGASSWAVGLAEAGNASGSAVVDTGMEETETGCHVGKVSNDSGPSTAVLHSSIACKERTRLINIHQQLRLLRASTDSCMFMLITDRFEVSI